MNIYEAINYHQGIGLSVTGLLSEGEVSKLAFQRL
jgi:hypothetical protein